MTSKKLGKVGIGETGLPSLDNFDGNEHTTTRHTETIMIGDAAVASGAEHPILIVVKGLDAGRIVTVGRAEVTIGRARECVLVVADRGVSGRHARLTLLDPHSAGATEGIRNAQFLLEDLRSKNGTFVGGVALKEPQKITYGDTFQVGPDVLIRLSRMTPAEDQAARHLYVSSMRDALTNVYNRRYFAQRIHAELAHAKRHDAPLSVLVLNLDNFKQVNDDHGHAVGDAVLQTLARILQRELRTEDVLARVESQDFGMILRGLGEKEALECAERLRRAVGREVQPRPDSPSMTASIGLATSVDESENILELASSRLRMAKSLGRNQVVWS